MAGGRFRPISPVRVDKAVTEVLTRTGSPSASVAVVVDDKIVLAEAYGDARLDPALKATASTRYGIGSISKQFTADRHPAPAVRRQAQPRRPRLQVVFLDLTDGPTRSPCARSSATTAGYQDFYAEDYTLTPMHEAHHAGGHPWRAGPRSRWISSQARTGSIPTPATSFAGRIVEKVSGQPLFAFLKQHIFTPLHMDGAVDNDAKRISAPDAAGYTRAALGPVRPVIPEGSGWMYGAGELAMPARDVAKWDISEIDKSLLPPAAYADQIKTIKLNSGKDSGYALGLFVSKPGGRTMYEHSGEIAGFVSDNRVYPDEKAAIVVLTNIEANGAAKMIADRISDMILSPDPPGRRDQGRLLRSTPERDAGPQPAGPQPQRLLHPDHGG